MTPKQIKKAQKQKEKEEKRRKAKAKKGKGHIEDDTTLEVEEYRVPPKSVHVRLTKVEIQTPPVESITQEKGKGTKGPKVEGLWMNTIDVQLTYTLISCPSSSPISSSESAVRYTFKIHESRGRPEETSIIRSVIDRHMLKRVVYVYYSFHIGRSCGRTTA